MTVSSDVILIVEGDILVRHPLAQYLRECGFKVHEASNGGEARTALKATDLKIDVVLADMTTEGSGFALREWVRGEKIPVAVILAGSIEKAVDKAGTLCNEGPALAKPYQHHLVLDEIRRSLARRER
ncbi:response regulator [Mesorhizobium sp. B3-2-1]|uniref:response regulator n=1 Tax=Mesorhizobium sp. B3-2-1 TaxID=2589891 RepID=UPI00112EF8CA|nr:response regulator [Mesorhizobium sp. B3-2-1]TPI26620.1 response regulator [Mesorhizobium sp. B3-2-1]